MSLKKLSSDELNEFSGKKIIGVEYNETYLKELVSKFGITKNIDFIIDDNIRNQGMHTFESIEIKVTGFSVVSDDMAEESIFLIMSDYYYEAYNKLNSFFGLGNKKNVFYLENNETAIEMKYRNKYRDFALQNIVIFRSGPHAASYVKGMDFSDNARALFEYMLANGFNEKYELVWLVKNPDEFSQYKDINNVKFISFDWSVSENRTERNEYYRVLCLAKYIFFTDAYGFARNCRKDQVRVQLWHGCGFKTRVNFARCENRYEYTTVISNLYKKIHADIYGLREDQILVTGYAKQDWLFHPAERNVLREIGIPDASKYIFWLPTFRTTESKLKELNEYSLNSVTGLPIIEKPEDLSGLNDILCQNGIVLVIKLHPFQNKNDIHIRGCTNIKLLDNSELITNDIQINQILGYADALISDYSSAAVDYMLLDRPIGFTLEDVEEYENGRGFVFDNIREWLPGEEIYNYSDFIKFVSEIGEGKDLSSAKRKKLMPEMHKFCDDQNCKRIVEALGI